MDSQDKQADPSKDLKVSVVIPCRDEERTLADVVQCAISSLNQYGLPGEVIVVDNASTDGSRKLALSLPVKVVDVPEIGYGRALKGGMEAARGRYIITADADDTYDLKEMDRIVKALDAGNDLVMGTRLRGNIENGAMPPLHRYLGTPVLTFLINILFGAGISDCNSGMRGITREAFQRLQLKSPGMEFASEMIVKSAILKLKITEVPVSLRVDRRLRHSHLWPWYDGARHLCLILTSWLNTFR
jgi:glycosyltransferase involved in cell wall biosynthesis